MKEESTLSEAPVAIITGAGTGIGRAAAIELAGAASGWRCAIVGRRREKLEETVLAMRERNAAAESIVLDLDVANPLAADEIIGATIAKWGGRIDALINNAATLITGPIHQAGDDALRQSLEVNTIAPARLVRGVWPHMRKSGGGRIINVSSKSSIDPFPGLGVYGMSKAALEGLTRAINKEGRSERIIAFSLVLGAVETDMLRSFASEKMLPRSKAKEPAEVGGVIASLARGERDGDAGTPIILN